MTRVAACVLALACAACGGAKTSAVIELQSDFDDAIDDIDVEIRDARDAQVLSQANFARAFFRMPFSFGVQPQASMDAFVVKATAHASGREPVIGKLRVSYEAGRTVHRTLFLQSVCAGKTCGDGESCDPVGLGCGAVPDGDASAAADGGASAAGGGSDASQADVHAAADGGGGGSLAPPQSGTHVDANTTDGMAGSGGGVAGAAADGGAAAGEGGRGGGGGSVGGAGSPAAGSGGAPAGQGGGGAAAGQGGASALPDVGRGTLTDKQWASVMHGGRNYTIHSNVYGPGAMTIDYAGASFTVTSESGSAPGGVAAPAVFIGRVYDEGMADDVLPRRVSDLRRVPVAFTHNGGSVDGGFRAIVSVWLSATDSADTGFSTGGTLEVWPYAKPGQTPNGSVQAHAISLPGVSGSWDVWVGTYSDRPAVVYLRTEATSMVQIDLKPFLTDAAQRPNAIDAAWYVTSISAGFDIYDGGAGLHIDVANISAE